MAYLRSGLATVAQRIMQYRQYRQTYDALSVLSDAQLDDLGLTRDGLGKVARRVAELD